MFVPYKLYIQGSRSLWILYTLLGDNFDLFIGLLPGKDIDEEGNEYPEFTLIPEEVHLIDVPKMTEPTLYWIDQTDCYSNKRFRQYLNCLYILPDQLYQCESQVSDLLPLDSHQVYFYTPNDQLTCIFVPFCIGAFCPCPAINTASFRLRLKLEGEGLM